MAAVTGPVLRGALLLFCAVGAMAQAAPESGSTPRSLAESLARGNTEDAQRAHDALFAMGPVALTPLLECLARAEHADSARIAGATERILLRCAGPGREADRRAAAAALRAAIDGALAAAQDSGGGSLAACRQYVRWLGLIGDAGEAEYLVRLAREQALAEEAVNALLRLESESWRDAGAVLFHPEAPRMAEIAARAAGEAGTPGGVALLRVLAEKTSDEAAARAAHEALAKLGAGVDAERLKHGAIALAEDALSALGVRQVVSMIGRGQTAPAAEKFILRRMEEADSRREIGVLLAALCAAQSKKVVPLAISYINDTELHGLCRWVIATAPKEAEEMLRTAYGKSQGGTRAALLEALYQRDADAHRALIEEALDAPDPEPRLVAARLLRLPAEADDALALARSGPGWLRADALRMALDAGHAAVIGGEPAMGAAIFRRVLSANLPQAWNESLEALGACGLREDEPLLRRFEDIGECREAAQVARAVLTARTFPEAEARPMLESLAVRAASDRVAATAAAALEQHGAAQTALPAARGYLLEWWQLGPFSPAEGGPPDDQEIVRAASTREPVTHAGERHAWTRRGASGLPAQVVAHEETVALRVYALGRVPMPVWTPCSIEVLAPGEVALWINGKAVAARERRADILLEPGINSVLLRLDAVCGGCGYGARLLSRRGAPLNLTQAAPPPDIAQDIGINSATLGAMTERSP